MSTPLVLPCTACGALNRVPAERLAAGPTCGRCHGPLRADAPVEVDDDRLERLVKASTVPVLVDFWAPWCGPCRMVAPHLEALARQEQGRLIVAKINVDHHTRVAGQLGVQGIPTLAVYRGGRLERSESGARTGPALHAFVAPYLPS
ncbi:MAG: thiol reductase thioredoxin [Alphaproteobacteria bacterium]|nr:thiol reductase thioredoxin [Alphaproteobacteria bacterium]